MNVRPRKCKTAQRIAARWLLAVGTALLFADHAASQSPRAATSMDSATALAMTGRILSAYADVADSIVAPHSDISDELADSLVSAIESLSVTDDASLGMLPIFARFVRDSSTQAPLWSGGEGTARYRVLLAIRSYLMKRRSPASLSLLMLFADFPDDSLRRDAIRPKNYAIIRRDPWLLPQAGWGTWLLSGLPCAGTRCPLPGAQGVLEHLRISANIGTPLPLSYVIAFANLGRQVPRPTSTPDISERRKVYLSAVRGPHRRLVDSLIVKVANSLGVALRPRDVPVLAVAAEESLLTQHSIQFQRVPPLDYSLAVASRAVSSLDTVTPAEPLFALSVELQNYASAILGIDRVARVYHFAVPFEIQSIPPGLGPPLASRVTEFAKPPNAVAFSAADSSKVATCADPIPLVRFREYDLKRDMYRERGRILCRRGTPINFSWDGSIPLGLVLTLRRYPRILDDVATSLGWLAYGRRIQGDTSLTELDFVRSNPVPSLMILDAALAHPVTPWRYVHEALALEGGGLSRLALQPRRPEIPDDPAFGLQAQHTSSEMTRTDLERQNALSTDPTLYASTSIPVHDGQGYTNWARSQAEYDSVVAVVSRMTQAEFQVMAEGSFAATLTNAAAKLPEKVTVRIATPCSDGRSACGYQETDEPNPRRQSLEKQAATIRDHAAQIDRISGSWRFDRQRCAGQLYSAPASPRIVFSPDLSRYVSWFSLRSATAICDIAIETPFLVSDSVQALFRVALGNDPLFIQRYGLDLSGMTTGSAERLARVLILLSEESRRRDDAMGALRQEQLLPWLPAYNATLPQGVSVPSDTAIVHSQEGRLLVAIATFLSAAQYAVDGGPPISARDTLVRQAWADSLLDAYEQREAAVRALGNDSAALALHGLGVATSLNATSTSLGQLSAVASQSSSRVTPSDTSALERAKLEQQTCERLIGRHGQGGRACRI